METNDIPPPRAEIRLQELGLDYDCTEVGNMERLVTRCRGQFLYIPEKRSWAHWKGDRWSICGNATIFQAGLQTARTLFDEARDCQTEEGRRRLGHFCCFIDLISQTIRYIRQPWLLDGNSTFPYTARGFGGQNTPRKASRASTNCL